MRKMDSYDNSTSYGGYDPSKYEENGANPFGGGGNGVQNSPSKGGYGRGIQNSPPRGGAGDRGRPSPMQSQPKQQNYNRNMQPNKVVMNVDDQPAFNPNKGGGSLSIYE